MKKFDKIIIITIEYPVNFQSTKSLKCNNKAMHMTWLKYQFFKMHIDHGDKQQKFERLIYYFSRLIDIILK